MKRITGCPIYYKGIGFTRKNLYFDEYIRPAYNYKCEELNLPGNLFLIPGLIDEHIHGANGFDSMDVDLKSLEGIAEAEASDGVTSFLFTTMTEKKDKIINALRNISWYLKDKSHFSRALGIHLEGPFISKKYKGAQDEKFILPLDPSLLDELIRYGNGCIKELTFSYAPNCDQFIGLAQNADITLSLGHTDCSSQSAKECFSKGVKCVTHMYNAMTPFTHREAGVVGAALLDDRVKTEVIADLIHVDQDALKLLYRMKGRDNIILITDSMEARGLNDGVYHLGGSEVILKEREARLACGTLAGSVLHLNDAVRNMQKCLGIPLTEAIDMASKNPAINLGIYDKVGSIDIGKRADFALVDFDMNVYMTIVGGEVVYQR